MLTQVLPQVNSYQANAVTNYHRTGGNLDCETWVSYTPIRYTEAEREWCKEHRPLLPIEMCAKEFGY